MEQTEKVLSTKTRKKLKKSLLSYKTYFDSNEVIIFNQNLKRNSNKT